MPKFMDLTGNQFGRLTAVGEFRRSAAGTDWKCLCVCGVEVVVRGGHLLSGNTTSCGCLQRERSSEANSQHRHSLSNSRRSYEYSCWINMRKRCTNPSHKSWKYYGGRGILVCESWSNSFVNFLQDIGPAPSRSHSLDRKNGNGNYEPGNVKWSTRKEQMGHTSYNKKLEFKGETKNLCEWAELYKIKQDVLRGRLKLGWDIEIALTTPVGKKRS